MAETDWGNAIPAAQLPGIMWRTQSNGYSRPRACKWGPSEFLTADLANYADVRRTDPTDFW
jgi:hypothetical protein